MKLFAPFDKGKIPVTFTGDGDNVAPVLKWTDPPQGTEAFALVCFDPDAPSTGKEKTKTWMHWMVYDIPPEFTSIKVKTGDRKERTIARCGAEEGSVKQGINDFARVGYDGPLPPKSHGPHRYFFRLYALRAETGLRPGLPARRVLAVVKEKTIAKVDVVGKYKRKVD